MPAPTLPGCTERYDFLLGRAVQGDVVLVRGEVDLVQVDVSTVPRPALHQPPDTGSQPYNISASGAKSRQMKVVVLKEKQRPHLGIKVFLSCVRI
jgi:hypothetical protein